MVPQCSHIAELIRLYAHDVGSSSYINYNSIKLFFFFFFKKIRLERPRRRSGCVSLNEQQGGHRLHTRRSRCGPSASYWELSTLVMALSVGGWAGQVRARRTPGSPASSDARVGSLCPWGTEASLRGACPVSAPALWAAGTASRSCGSDRSRRLAAWRRGSSGQRGSVFSHSRSGARAARPLSALFPVRPCPHRHAWGP